MRTAPVTSPQIFVATAYPKTRHRHVTTGGARLGMARIVNNASRVLVVYLQGDQMTELR